MRPSGLGSPAQAVVWFRWPEQRVIGGHRSRWHCGRAPTTAGTRLRRRVGITPEALPEPALQDDP
jgi:hypothetical protein